MAKPPQLDMISELGPVLKPRYPRRKMDPFGIKFQKGHRVATQLSGQRPLKRAAKRPR